MFTNLQSTLFEAGSAAYRAFAAPGSFVFETTLSHAPGLAAFLKFDSFYAPTLVVFLLSLLYWFLVIVLLKLLARLGRYVTWQIGALVRTALFRLSRYFRGIKTSTILRMREWFPKRREADLDIPMIEFDKLDIAVLRSASAIGPGMALSAADLAGRFKLRPSQVQSSLEKLSNNKMLMRVIGATDGFDNFRVTDSGNAFLAMWQRQSPLGD
jgi:hypothetical protein